MPRVGAPITTLPSTSLVDFETDEGIFGFRYDRLLHYRWETHTKTIGPQAIHLFFDSATVSVVGHGLRTILPLIRRQRICEFRLGKRAQLSITYISVLPHDGQRKHEGVNRGLL